MSINQPHDMPDMWPWLPGSNKGILGDLGEHAVRLGSSLWYDRRGEQVFSDNFACGLAGYTASPYGTGASIVIGCSFTSPSGYNARLTCGSALDDYAILDKCCTPLLNNRLGVEMNFGIETEYGEIHLVIRDYLGTTKTEWTITLRRSDNKLCYIDSAGDDQSFAAIPNPIDAYGVGHTLKFVVNREEQTYDRVMYDDNDYDLTGKLGWEESVVSTRTIGLAASIWGNGGGNRRMLLNHLILTDNEP